MAFFNDLRSNIVGWLFPAPGSHTATEPLSREGGSTFRYGNSATSVCQGHDFMELLDTNNQTRKFNINPKTAISIPAVLACIKVIAETIATLPCHIYTIGTQTCDYGTFRCSIFREQTI